MQNGKQRLATKHTKDKRFKFSLKSLIEFLLRQSPLRAWLRVSAVRRASWAERISHRALRRCCWGRSSYICKHHVDVPSSQINAYVANQRYFNGLRFLVDSFVPAAEKGTLIY